MGCTASSSEQPIEILNRCVVPGVKFEEKIIGKRKNNFILTLTIR